jgi:teichuronic acid biosynthesis glycosyltransferase TuaC
MSRRLRVLVITKIFPNAAEPMAAAFNRQQIAALSKRASVEILATIPWFPGAGLLGERSSAGALARVPRRDVVHGMAVRHPRTLFVPRVGHGLWAPLYAASLAPIAIGYRGKVDVVFGTWAYPDGVASVALARLIGVPAVVKLHGSDMNVIAELPGPKRILQLMLPRAQRVIAVSRGLADKAREVGVPDDRLRIVMNGVDGDLFKPRDRKESRAKLGLPADARVVLYVGNLKEVKGILDLVPAFDRIATANPDVHLAIVGDGPLRSTIDALASRWRGRVTVAGARPLDEIPVWMGACDILTLPSWAEGTPNVLLEVGMAGRRVVATTVGGIPDVINDPRLGVLVPPHDPDTLGRAIAEAAHAYYDPDALATLGARGGWDESAASLLGVLEEAYAVTAIS